MEEDDIAELMSEPPGGSNAGWTKTQEGTWRSLEHVEEHPKHRQVFVDTPRVHGFAYGYVRLECRCPLCVAWKTVYDADRRNGK